MSYQDRDIINQIVGFFDPIHNGKIRTFIDELYTELIYANIPYPLITCEINKVKFEWNKMLVTISSSYDINDNIIALMSVTDIYGNSHDIYDCSKVNFDLSLPISGDITAFSLTTATNTICLYNEKCNVYDNIITKISNLYSPLISGKFTPVNILNIEKKSLLNCIKNKKYADAQTQTETSLSTLSYLLESLIKISESPLDRFSATELCKKLKHYMSFNDITINDIHTIDRLLTTFIFYSSCSDDIHKADEILYSLDEIYHSRNIVSDNTWMPIDGLYGLDTPILDSDDSDIETTVKIYGRLPSFSDSSFTDDYTDERTDERIEERTDEETEEEIDERTDEETDERIEEETEEEIDERIEEETEERTEEEIDERIEERTDERIEERTDERIEERTEEEIDERIEERTEERTDERIEERTEEEIDERTEDKIARENDILNIQETIEIVHEEAVLPNNSESQSMCVIC